MLIGLVCCVSYKYTASEVATAYTIRYARPNAEGGPAGRLDAGPASSSEVLGDGAVILGEGEGALVKGGGSIE
jgi:hypothetical protein